MNQQTRLNLPHSVSEFLHNYKLYGFENKSSMVEAALLRLKEDVQTKNLFQSAKLYAEVYDGDEDLQELIESANQEWPE